MIKLVDGEAAQARIASNLLGRQRHLDPGIGRESASGVLLDVAPRIGLDLIARATLLTVADVEHLTLVASEQRHDLVDDVAAALSAGRGDRTEIVARDVFKHAAGRARLTSDQRRRLAAPAVDPRQRHSFEDVVVHARGIAPCADIAGLVHEPPPRHEATLAQPHGSVADVLPWRARALVAVGVAIGFWDDALLLQLIEQESDVGRNGAFALMVLQQGEAGALQSSSL